MLNLILQRRQTRDNLLALLNFLGLIGRGDSLMKVIDGARLRSNQRCVSALSRWAPLLVLRATDLWRKHIQRNFGRSCARALDFDQYHMSQPYT